MRVTLKLAGLILVIVATVTVTACATPKPSVTASASSRDSGITFTGPWASRFQQAYGEANSDDEREALADSTISDAEYAYFHHKIIKCLGEKGLTNPTLTNGTLEYGNPKKLADSEIDGCTIKNGIKILSLRDGAQRNPQNVDENQIMASCLVKSGLVPESYTERDYLNGMKTQKFPFDIRSPKFDQCTSDPLGLLAQ